MHARDMESGSGQMTASIAKERPIKGSELRVTVVTAAMMRPSPHKGDGGIIDRHDPAIPTDDDGSDFYPDK